MKNRIVTFISHKIVYKFLFMIKKVDAFYDVASTTVSKGLLMMKEKSKHNVVLRKF